MIQYIKAYFDFELEGIGSAGVLAKKINVELCCRKIMFLWWSKLQFRMCYESSVGSAFRASVDPVLLEGASVTGQHVIDFICHFSIR